MQYKDTYTPRPRCSGRPPSGLTPGPEAVSCCGGDVYLRFPSSPAQEGSAICRNRARVQERLGRRRSSRRRSQAPGTNSFSNPGAQREVPPLTLLSWDASADQGSRGRECPARGRLTRSSTIDAGVWSDTQQRPPTNGTGSLNLERRRCQGLNTVGSVWTVRTPRAERWMCGPNRYT